MPRLAPFCYICLPLWTASAAQVYVQGVVLRHLVGAWKKLWIWQLLARLQQGFISIFFVLYIIYMLFTFIYMLFSIIYQPTSFSRFMKPLPIQSSKSDWNIKLPMFRLAIQMVNISLTLFLLFFCSFTGPLPCFHLRMESTEEMNDRTGCWA